MSRFPNEIQRFARDHIEVRRYPLDGSLERPIGINFDALQMEQTAAISEDMLKVNVHLKQVLYLLTIGEALDIGQALIRMVAEVQIEQDRIANHDRTGTLNEQSSDGN